MEETLPNSEKVASQIKDDFFKILPIVPIWFSILGATKLYLFYSPYKINIFEYIDFQDILLFFVGDFYGAFISFSVLGLTDFITFQSEPTNWSEYFEPPKFWINWSNGVKATLWVAYKTITNPLIIFGMVICYFNLVNVVEHPIITATIIGGVAVFIKNRVYFFLIKHINKSVARAYMIYFSLFFALLFLTVMSVTMNKNKIVNKYNAGSCLKTSNEIINFGKNQQLLGRTRNFTFIFTPADSSTRIINNADIKEIFVKVNE